MSEGKGSVTALLSGIAAIITAMTGVYLAYNSNSDNEPHLEKTIIVESNNNPTVVDSGKYIKSADTNSAHNNLIGTWSGELIIRTPEGGISRMIFQDTYNSFGGMKTVGQLYFDIPSINNNSANVVAKVKATMNWSIDGDNIVLLVRDREVNFISFKLNGVEIINYSKELTNSLDTNSLYAIGQTEKRKIIKMTASSLNLEFNDNNTGEKRTVFMSKIVQ